MRKARVYPSRLSRLIYQEEVKRKKALGFQSRFGMGLLVVAVLVLIYT